MDRKRREPDALTTSQRLTERIRGFRTGARQPNAALDALTGKRAIEDLANDIGTATPPRRVPAAVDEPAITPPAEPAVRPPLLRRLSPTGAPAPTVGDAPARPIPEQLANALMPQHTEHLGAPRPHTDRYTVYLGQAEVDKLSYIASCWPASERRPNRSKLIRTAIQALVQIVEQAALDSGPRSAAPAGGRRGHDTND